MYTFFQGGWWAKQLYINWLPITLGFEALILESVDVDSGEAPG